jgi:predicted O-linked N-acetylglucosamine transferase (SPINDLY family)
MLGWLRSRISLALRQAPTPDASRTAEACFHLGNLHCSHGRLGDAERAYRDALRLRPAYADALNNLGSLLKDTGRVAEAEHALSDAVRLRPHFAEAHFNLGTLLVDLRRYSEATEHLRSSLAADPKQADAQYWLGNASMGLGDSRAACAAYEAAVHLDAGHAKARWGLVMAQVPPVIDADAAPGAAAAAFVRELGKAGAWLVAQKPKDAHAIVGAQQPFYLAYVEGNHRDALSEYGQLCADLMSQWAAGVGLPAPAVSTGAKCRVGIVSSHIHNHSVWNAIVRGWVEHLDPKRFELHLFHTGGVEDGETAWAERRVSTLHHGSRDGSEWAKVISGARLDVLLYPEIGMDATTVRLACLRLARVQLASWGHPITTGLPTLDGYLSAEAFEPAGAAAAYREALFLLPRLGCCYRPFRTPAAPVDLADFGVASADRVLVCAGAPSKYGPRYDALWIEVAKQCRPCKLIFFHSDPSTLGEPFERRLASAFARAGVDFGSHVRFVPRLSQAKFFGLLARSHAMLDSPGFSGFNTAMQAIECGCPIIAWEGDAMRSRFASAILQQMGLDDCVCNDPATFVARAARLCNDKAHAAELRDRIAARREPLFDDRGAVDALGELLSKLAAP